MNKELIDEGLVRKIIEEPLSYEGTDVVSVQDIGNLMRYIVAIEQKADALRYHDKQSSCMRKRQHDSIVRILKFANLLAESPALFPGVPRPSYMDAAIDQLHVCDEWFFGEFGERFLRRPIVLIGSSDGRYTHSVSEMAADSSYEAVVAHTETKFSEERERIRSRSRLGTLGADIYIIDHDPRGSEFDFADTMNLFDGIKDEIQGQGTRMAVVVPDSFTLRYLRGFEVPAQRRDDMRALSDLLAYQSPQS